MLSTPRFPVLSRLAILAFSIAGSVFAGPPFITDDPEPVELHQWEVYYASIQSHTSQGWLVTAPHVEVNYGALPDLQLHVIAPLAFSTQSENGALHYGYADTELGVKYRFIQETPNCPQVGIFPFLELPTGSQEHGLGNGKAQLFIPVWLQKTIGAWSSYGGGGYWFNPGSDNINYWFAGWQVQRKITEEFSLGLEIYHETPKIRNGSSDTVLNLGAIYDLSETYHLMASAGHSVQGPSQFIGYLALQMTFGPKGEKPETKK
jgi:hypothetical protein